MSAELIRALNIGIPILIAVLIVTFVIVLIREAIKASREAKNAVNAFVYIRPENGGGYELRLHSKDLTKPNLRPVWYREHWYSAEIPIYFFYEDKVTVTSQPAVKEGFKCSCGYEAVSKIALHAHTMWNPSRKVDGKPITKEAWVKIHSKVETSKATVAPAATTTQFVIKPYDIDAATEDPAITPFAVFDLNNWDCQKQFLATRISGLHKALQLGAGVVMVIACILGIIVLAGELNKAPTGSTQVSKPVTQIINGEH